MLEQDADLAFRALHAWQLPALPIYCLAAKLSAQKGNFAALDRLLAVIQRSVAARDFDEVSWRAWLQRCCCGPQHCCSSQPWRRGGSNQPTYEMDNLLLAVPMSLLCAGTLSVDWHQCAVPVSQQFIALQNCLHYEPTLAVKCRCLLRLCTPAPLRQRGRLCRQSCKASTGLPLGTYRRLFLVRLRPCCGESRQGMPRCAVQDSFIPLPRHCTSMCHGPCTAHAATHDYAG